MDEEMLAIEAEIRGYEQEYKEHCSDGFIELAKEKEENNQ